MLERMGFECEEAGDGLAGLDKVRAGPNFELALVDWNMPVMNGLEMLQELRAEGFDRVKVMMVTTEADNDFILQALDAGANEYLMKPFDEEGLADKLALIDLVEV
jgi:two-component system chemotaxis response regulator CheY